MSKTSNSVWTIVIRVIIAAATALLGAIGMEGMSGDNPAKDN